MENDNMKNELITLYRKLDKLQEEIRELNSENEDQSQLIIRLYHELDKLRMENGRLKELKQLKQGN